jgi:hypothetical protein
VQAGKNLCAVRLCAILRTCILTLCKALAEAQSTKRIVLKDSAMSRAYARFSNICVGGAGGHCCNARCTIERGKVGLIALILRLHCGERLKPSKIFTVALRYISSFFWHAPAVENIFHDMNGEQNLFLHHAAAKSCSSTQGMHNSAIKPTVSSMEEPVAERAFARN